MSKAAAHFIKSDKLNAPTIALIPGGPGLSSQTLRSLEILKSSFNLVFIDPPGTGASEVNTAALSYSEALSEIGNALAKYNDLILLGHSFGGIQAADLIASKTVRAAGLVCLSTPFSEQSWNSIEQQYAKRKSEKLNKAEIDFENDSTDMNFKRWLASYGPLYFAETSREAGEALLLHDKASASVFMEVGKDAVRHQTLLALLNEIQLPKIMIHGSADLLVPESAIRRDSNAGGFDYHLVDNGGHFLSLDAPEQIKSILEKSFL